MIVLPSSPHQYYWSECLSVLTQSTINNATSISGLTGLHKRMITIHQKSLGCASRQNNSSTFLNAFHDSTRCSQLVNIVAFQPEGHSFESSQPWSTSSISSPLDARSCTLVLTGVTWGDQQLSNLQDQSRMLSTSATLVLLWIICHLRVFCFIRSPKTNYVNLVLEENRMFPHRACIRSLPQLNTENQCNR